MGHASERHDLVSYETHSGMWIAFRQPVLREAARRIHANAPVAIDLGVHPRLVFELGRRGEILEDRVVVGTDVSHRLVQGGVQHVPRPQQLVEAEADQERGLADTVPCEHHAQKGCPCVQGMA